MTDHKISLKQFQAIREIISNLNDDKDFDIMNWELNYLKQTIKVTFKELQHGRCDAAYWRNKTLQIPLVVLNNTEYISPFITYLRAKYNLQDYEDLPVIKKEIEDIEDAISKLHTINDNRYIDSELLRLRSLLQKKKTTFNKDYKKLVELQNILKLQIWNKDSTNQTSLEIVHKFLFNQNNKKIKKSKESRESRESRKDPPKKSSKTQIKQQGDASNGQSK